MDAGAPPVTLTLEHLLHLATSKSIFLARRNTDNRFLVAKLYNRTHIQSQPDIAHTSCSLRGAYSRWHRLCRTSTSLALWARSLRQHRSCCLFWKCVPAASGSLTDKLHTLGPHRRLLHPQS
jgi:hypothetical protein